MATDTERFDYIEQHTSFHRNLDITYVVGGYNVCLVHDWEDISPTFHAETLREAIDKLMEWSKQNGGKA